MFSSDGEASIFEVIVRFLCLCWLQAAGSNFVQHAQVSFQPIDPCRPSASAASGSQMDPSFTHGGTHPGFVIGVPGRGGGLGGRGVLPSQPRNRTRSQKRAESSQIWVSLSG